MKWFGLFAVLILLKSPTQQVSAETWSGLPDAHNPASSSCLTWKMEVRFGVEGSESSTAWLACARSSDRLVAIPYWIDMTQGVSPAANFWWGRAFHAWNDSISCIASDTKVYQLEQAAPQESPLYGDYNFADVLCYLYGDFDTIQNWPETKDASGSINYAKPKAARPLALFGRYIDSARVELPSKAGNEWTTSYYENGEEVATETRVYEGERLSSARYSIPARTVTLTASPALNEPVAAFGLKTNESFPYLAEGREIEITFTSVDEHVAVPEYVVMTTPGKGVVYEAAFSEYSLIPTQGDTPDLLLEVRTIAENTSFGLWREVMSRYERLVLEGSTDPINSSTILGELKKLDRSISSYGRETVFANKEAQLGCLARMRRFGEVSQTIVVHQLPLLMAGGSGKTFGDYIVFWTAFFAKHGPHGLAEEILTAGSEIVKSTWKEDDRDLLIRWLKERSGTEEDILTSDICSAFSTVLRDGGHLILPRQVSSARRKGSKERHNFRVEDHTQSMKMLYSYLDIKFVQDAVPERAQEDPSATTVDSVSVTPSRLPTSVSGRRPTGNNTGLTDKETQDRHSLIDKIVRIVRDLHQQMSRDQIKTLRTALEAVLLDTRHSISDTDRSLLLKYLKPTLSRWKLDNQYHFVRCVVTTQWVLREYFDKRNQLTKDQLDNRKCQLQWQQTTASGLLARIADGDQPVKKLDPRVPELIEMINADLKREMENPFNPFFRTPLAREQWNSYCEGVERQIQEELTALKKQFAEIDAYFKEQLDKSLKSDDPGKIDYFGERRRNRQWLEYQSCVAHVSAAIIRDYCMANFPPLDSPRFSPFKIKGVGVSYGVGSVVWVRLKPWMDQEEVQAESISPSE